MWFQSLYQLPMTGLTTQNLLLRTVLNYEVEWLKLKLSQRTCSECTRLASCLKVFGQILG